MMFLAVQTRNAAFLMPQRRSNAKRPTGPAWLAGPVFCVNLDHVLDSEGLTLNDVPRVVSKCLEFFEDEKMLQTEGLLRAPGSAQKVSKYVLEFDRRASVSFQGEDPLTVASVLLRFIRELPQPIIPKNLELQVAPLFGEQSRTSSRCAYVCVRSLSEAANGIRAKPRIIQSRLYRLVFSLPPHNYALFKKLCLFFNRVASFSSINKMTLENVITCTHFAVGTLPGLTFNAALLPLLALMQARNFDVREQRLRRSVSAAIASRCAARRENAFIALRCARKLDAGCEHV
jgi:hypothetical protein